MQILQATAGLRLLKGNASEQILQAVTMSFISYYTLAVLIIRLSMFKGFIF